MNTKLIVANWKSHKDVAEAKNWLEAYAKSSSAHSTALQVILAPPSSLLWPISEAISALKLPLGLGVQDLSPFGPGSYTGAIATENLQGLPVKYAIVGHSERRRYFHETHQQVANKVEQAVKAGITPIVCLDDEYLITQAAAIPQELLTKCVVAYEPIEAIGNDRNQPAEEVAPVVAKVRQYFGNIRVIYGGSAAAENVQSYLAVTDGVLVGHKSLAATDFSALVTAAATTA